MAAKKIGGFARLARPDGLENDSRPGTSARFCDRQARARSVAC